MFTSKRAIRIFWIIVALITIIGMLGFVLVPLLGIQ